MSNVLAEVALLVTTYEGLHIIGQRESIIISEYLENPTMELTKFSCTLMLELKYQRSLEIIVPESYPSHFPLVSVRGIEQRDHHEALNKRIAEYIRFCSHDEPILDQLIELVCNWNDQHTGKQSAEIVEPLVVKKQIIHRKILFWSHHLLATSKRKDIKDFSKELGLRTITRRGYPGFIAAEGEANGVEEFIKRIKSMRWAAIALKYDESRPHDQTDDCKVNSILQETFEETDDLSRFCQALETDANWKQSVMH